MSDFTESLRKFSGFGNGGVSEVPTQSDLGIGRISLPPVPASPEVTAPTVPTPSDLAVAPAPLTEAQKLAQDLAVFDKALSSPKEMAKFNLARERGNDLTKNNQIIQDRNTLDPVSFEAKWGPDVAEKINTLDRASFTLNRQKNTPRSWPEALGDSAIDVGSSLVNAVGGLGIVAAKLDGSANGAQAISEGLNRFTKFAQGYQSKGLSDSRKIDALKQELDNADENTRYEADKAEDGAFVASLRSIGRSALDTGGRLLEDPRLIGSLASQGLGSMLVAGPVGKAIGAGAGALGLNLATRSGVSAGALTAEGVGSQAAAKALEGSSMLAAIGAMEGGGAYADASQKVKETDDSALIKQSPDYAALRETMGETRAKAILADRAGSVALPLAAVTGAVTSKVLGTGKIEADLGKLATSGFKNAARDTLKETVEEGIQGATGQLASNVGQQASGANPNQSLIEGVGQGIVEGAVAGGLSAGGLAAPSVVAQGAASAVSGAASAAMNAVTDRANRIRSENEASSPVSNKTVAQSFQEAAQAVPEVSDALKTLVETAPAPEASTEASGATETGVDRDALIKRVEQATEITPEDAASLPEGLVGRIFQAFQETNTDPNRRVPNRFEALYVTGQIAADPQASPEDRVAAGTFLLEQLNRQKKLFQEDLPAALENVKQDSPEYQKFNDWSQVVNMITEAPGIKQAYEWAIQGIPAELQKVNLNENIPDQTVSNLVRLADTAPELVPAPLVAGVLKQSDEGKITLSPEQTRLLRGTDALLKAARVGEEAQADLGVSEDRVSLISKQIESTGGDKPYMRSMQQYVAEIAQAPSEQARKTALTNLGGFARAMRNKVEALNASVAQNGAKQSYQSWGPLGWIPPAKTQPLYVNTKSANSLNTAKAIYADALAVAELANQLSANYPEFNIKPVLIPALQLSGAPEGVSTPEPQDLRATTPSNAAVDQNPSSDRQVETPSPLSSAPAAEAVAEASREPTQDAVQEVGSQAVPSAVQTEEQPISEAAPKRETATVFSSLVKHQGKNWFQTAFRMPKTPISNLDGLDNPLSLFVDKSGDIPVSIKRLLNLSEDMLSVMQERLQARLTKPSKSGTWQEILAQNDPKKDILRWRDALILNLTREDGTYDPRLSEAAVLAGLDFSLNATASFGTLDREDIAQFTGMAPEQISETTVQAFNRGISVDQAKQRLGESILRFWGLQADPGVSDSLTKGIAEAMAAEVLKSLEATGLIKLGQIKLDKDYGRVWFDNAESDTKQISPEILDLRNAIKVEGTASFIADVVQVEKEVRGPLREPLKADQILRTQLRNPAVKLKPAQIEVLETVTKQVHHVNLVVHDFMAALGVENFVDLFGGLDLSKVTLNQQHRKSIEGINLQLRTSFQNMLGQVNALKNYALNQKLEPKDVPTYYGFAINKVGRLQMIGESNPQSDKLLREVFMPTRSVLDMTNPEHRDFFWMTVGQGLGVKTEYKFRVDVRADAEKRIAEKYRPIVDGMKTWLQQGGDLPAQVHADMKAAGVDSMHMIHSLLSVAQLENNPGATEFEHFNYLEADGKTNGPINSLMLLTTGPFTGEWLDDIAKGGAYIGETAPKSLNAYYNEGVGKNQEDLYKKTSNITQKKIRENAENWRKNNPRLYEQLQTFSRVFESLMGSDVTLTTDGDLIIERGVAKNPLTISIYGSGVDGIASKLTDELVTTFYEKMSGLIAQGKPLSDLITDDVKTLFTIPMKKNKKQETYVDNKPDPKAVQAFEKFMRMSAQNAKISPEMFRVLKSNVRMLFVDQLSAAIDASVMAHVLDSRNALQKATQLQSVALRSVFRNEVIALIADKQRYLEKYPDYKKGDSLSQKEVRGILKKLEPFSPFIETDTQSFFLAGGETSQLFEQTEIDGVRTKNVTVTDPSTGKTLEISLPSEFARSLSGDLSSPAYIYGPTLAGVRGVPSLVIGTGDGEMILQGVLKGAKGLPVFDGWNMAADRINEDGTRMNEAVYASWNKNTMQAVAESFRAFVRANPNAALVNDDYLNTQQKTYLLEVTKTLTTNREPEFIYDGVEAQAEMIRLAQDLERMADEIDARQQVIREFGISVDQMASAESPFFQAGKGFPEGLNQDDKATLLNARYEEILAEKDTARNASPIGVEAEVLKAAIKPFQDPETGASMISPELTEYAFKFLSEKLTGTQKEIFDNSVALVQKAGYQVVFGSSSELKHWEELHNAVRYNPSDYYTWGKIDPVSKLILISNLAPETVVHEFIHAATLDKVRAYYANETMPSEQHKAVERLELLMQEWLGQVYDAESPVIQGARSFAESAINQHLNSGRKAEALNEFMAWVLANQNLSETAEKSRVVNPLAKIVGAALKALRSLLGISSKVGDDMLSQIRFNARILMASPSSMKEVRQDAEAVALYQSSSFGSSDYLSNLMKTFNEKVINYLYDPIENLTLDPASVQKVAQGLQARQVEKNISVETNASKIAGIFEKAFSMTPQETAAFRSINEALAVDADLNHNALNRINEIYTEVVKQLQASDFQTGLSDPSVDAYQANEKYNTLMGINGLTKDKLGRSSLLPTFLALALTNEQFRGILAKMTMPKALKDESGTVDAFLINLGNAAMDRLGQTMAGDNKNPIIQMKLDNLAQKLVENVGDNRILIERNIGDKLDGFDKYLSQNIQRLADEREQKASERIKTSSSRVVRAASRMERLVASIVSEKSGAKLALGALQAINSREGLHALRAFVVDLMGENAENTGVYGLLSKVRTQIQQVRQDFRVNLPQIVSEQFSQKLTKVQWSALYRALAKTDLPSLISSYSREQVLGFITNKRILNRETSLLESEIMAADPTRATAIFAKAQQLARYMNTGHQGKNLLRNAHAVAHLLEEPQKAAPGSASAIVDMVDQLVTLYALKSLDPETRKTVSALVQTEAKGTTFILDYLTGLRKDELSKAEDNVSLYNHFKGHIPAISKEGVHLIVALDSEYPRLTKLGYIRVEAYKGSSAEFGAKPRSYYFSPVSGQAPYHQGVIQTVHMTVSGISPFTGFSEGTITAGRITDPAVVQRIKALSRNASETPENLLPVFDQSGQIKAYERAIDPKHLTLLDQDTSLHTMMGVWRGRQFEERLAQEYNNLSIDRLHENWIQGKKDKRQNEYVKLEDSTDPIIQEAWNLIPYAAKRHAKTVFGKDGFMVRSDMLNNAVGHRQASVGDVFTGNTRWSPAVQKKAEDIALGIFGANAYNKLVKYEGFIQNLVVNAKQMIVVKSVVVPAANIASNIYFKIIQGVPLRNIVVGYAKKTPEINYFIKSRNREVQIDAELLAAEGAGFARQIRILKTEKQAIQDAYRRLSIWPLIEAGEFGAISDGVVTTEDLALADGRWGNYVEKLAQKIPEGPLKTVYRNAFITKNTALFQGLSRAVQYGDFIAKAVLYDDLTKRQKVSSEDAIRQVRNDFVNYNLLAGRDRQYLESTGVLWFYNYKLRSAKIALNTLRQRPLTSLLMSGLSAGVPLFDIGTPLTDNIVSVAADGRLGYSIGPSMGINSFSLNPWINLVK